VQELSTASAGGQSSEEEKNGPDTVTSSIVSAAVAELVFVSVTVRVTLVLTGTDPKSGGEEREGDGAMPLPDTATVVSVPVI
jgi:hypothetical protein